MRIGLILIAMSSLAATSAAAEKTYRLKEVDLKQPILWGAECREPEGKGLAFGGEDQDAEDGCAHTRILVDGQWKDIHEELRMAYTLWQPLEASRYAREAVKTSLALARAIYFRGLPAAEEQAGSKRDAIRLAGEAIKQIADALKALQAVENPRAAYEGGQEGRAATHWSLASDKLKPLATALAGGVTPDVLKALLEAQVNLEMAAAMLDAEPPPRAMSPIVFDAKTGLYVLFGGDHLDYLTNDTWVFDPAKKRWFERHPKTSPPPRHGHTLKAAGDGKVVLSEGYTYACNTDYMGGQYKDVGDGEWTYDVAADAWAAPAKWNRRTYASIAPARSVPTSSSKARSPMRPPARPC